MDGLDPLSFVELDPPTARGPLSDDKTLKIAVSGVSPSPQRAHSNAIAERERRLRFQRSVRFGTRAARFPQLIHHVSSIFPHPHFSLSDPRRFYINDRVCFYFV